MASQGPKRTWKDVDYNLLRQEYGRTCEQFPTEVDLNAFCEGRQRPGLIILCDAVQAASPTLYQKYRVGMVIQATHRDQRMEHPGGVKVFFCDPFAPLRVLVAQFEDALAAARQCWQDAVCWFKINEENQQEPYCV